MNLRRIIRESINSVILDSIISEEIIKESGSARNNMRKGAPNNRRQAYQPKQNLQQKKQQNAVQAAQAAANKKQQNVVSKQQAAADREQRANAGRQERFNQWSNQWANKNLPQESPDDTQQGGYGYTNSGFDYSENGANTNNTNTAQQANQQTNQQQSQQKPSVDYSQYADALRKIVGNRGIDPKPVQNNQAAVQHIDQLNHFVFSVIGAIDSDNINGVNSPATGDKSTYYRNPFGKDLTDLGLDASKGIVNYLGDTMDNIGRGPNNPLNGVFKAGVNAYNDTHNAFGQLMRNMEYSSLGSDKSQRIPSNAPLTELMKIYPNLFSQYQQINNGNNGIFSGVPNVSQCYEVLNRLYQTVASSAKQQAQQQKQQQTQTPQGGVNKGGVTQTTQGSNVTHTRGNNTDNEQYYHNLAGKLDTLQQECYNMAAKNKVNHTFDENVENALEWMGGLCKQVVSANDNNDKQKLMKLLSLDGREYNDIPTYDIVKEIYEKEYELFEEEPGYGIVLQNMKKAMMTLKQFRDQFITDNGINNNR